MQMSSLSNVDLSAFTIGSSTTTVFMSYKLNTSLMEKQSWSGKQCKSMTECHS